MTPPPILDGRSRRDQDHLQLLAVFHFIVAGFAVAGIGFLLLHDAFMNAIFANPAMWKDQPNGSPAEFFRAIIGVFKWCYVVMTVFGVAIGTANVMSGIWLRKQKKPDVLPGCVRPQLSAGSIRHRVGSFHDHRPDARLGTRPIRVGNKP